MWLESRQHQRGLRNGERRPYLIILHQLLIAVNGFGTPKINAVQNDYRFRGWFHIDLQRRLSVQFDSEVDYIASFQ